MPERLLTVQELSQRLRIPEKTIRNCLGPKAKRRFPIKPKRIGKRVFFREADVDSFILSLSTDPVEYFEESTGQVGSGVVLKST